MTYTLVVKRYKEDFIAAIDLLLDEGWTLYGSPFAESCYKNDSNYCQALVHYGPEENRNSNRVDAESRENSGSGATQSKTAFTPADYRYADNVVNANDEEVRRKWQQYCLDNRICSSCARSFATCSWRDYDNEKCHNE